VLTPLGIGGIWIGGISVLSVIALALAIAALISVFKNPEISGGTKAMWTLAILVFPILGSLVYFSVRSDW
jgi:phospholipase D-like protein